MIKWKADEVGERERRRRQEDVRDLRECFLELIYTPGCAFCILHRLEIPVVTCLEVCFKFHMRHIQGS